MSLCFDEQEQQLPAERERQLFSRLPQHLAFVVDKSPHYRGLFEGINPAGITDRTALATLPVTRKSQLIGLQQQQPPFGGLAAEGRALARAFQSPGPIYEPQGESGDWWGMARAFHAAGFRPGDLVLNTLSYHLTPGGFIMDAGARGCGCTVIPAGPGQTEQQLEVIEALRPDGYCGTPSFLKILLTKAEEQGRDVSSLTKALVTGEALPAKLRDEFAARGIQVLQAYASADIGLIAYESDSREGLIVNEQLILEIVRPGTGEPVAEGEVGEVVVTRFNDDYPMIRFATGDLSAILAGQSPCGRTNARIKGWLGRADQTTKVKGMFVHPEQVAEVVKRHDEIQKARLVVSREQDNDTMVLMCETASALSDETLAAVTDTLRAVTKLNGKVVAVSTGDLVNDGKVIEDQRTPG